MRWVNDCYVAIFSHTPLTELLYFLRISHISQLTALDVLNGII